MVAKKPDPADLLEAKLRVVAAAIPGLRKHGVSKITLGELTVEIDAPPPAETKSIPRGAPDPDLEDLLDPKKFRRPRDNPEDER